MPSAPPVLSLVGRQGGVAVGAYQTQVGKPVVVGVAIDMIHHQKNRLGFLVDPFPGLRSANLTPMWPMP